MGVIGGGGEVHEQLSRGMKKMTSTKPYCNRDTANLKSAKHYHYSSSFWKQKTANGRVVKGVEFMREGKYKSLIFNVMVLVQKKNQVFIKKILKFCAGRPIKQLSAD
ncbi:MAG: hypothetical protein PHV80_06435 [Rugosibacter sp.]|nr:hypothetical protein [Rugosibacter sp.]